MTEPTVYEIRQTRENSIERSWRLDQPSLTVGRSKHNPIQLDDPCVSRHHATFRMDGKTLTVKNASSKGVWVNATRIASVTTLQHGDTLAIGNCDLSVSLIGLDDPATDPAPRRHRAAPPKNRRLPPFFSLHLLLILSWLALAGFTAARYLQSPSHGYRYQTRLVSSDDARGMSELLTQMHAGGWEIDFKSDVTGPTNGQQQIMMIFKQQK
ncbi:MAG: FHA domain-containing protein [Verrucomicrobiota bacterium]